jgi:hypothetical protein
VVEDQYGQRQEQAETTEQRDRGTNQCWRLMLPTRAGTILQLQRSYEEQRWEHLAEADITSHFEECNTTGSATALAGPD